ncbi:hypothetical protein CN072_22330 [Sinorhizobium meliloti]|uniref:hypothetical protein n=1 Tax=Rhizobium meliloti TaxID=382 RepID=UPI000FD58402|nr:hypothetical protein [Sinorhizobium meliloti]RVG92100.1 hypothetical protein CN218_18640 [Sinorhizobium meliloti]RVP82054.1 hypothetical protein CN072_22330 [Sinorhizobium meliloti]
MVRVLLILLGLAGSAAAAPVPDNAAAVKDLADAHRSERDVVAQETMAWWTWFMALTSVGATLLSGGAAGAALYSVALSRRALEHAEASVSETIKIGRQQSRAYVHASDVSYSTEAPDVIVHVTNTGQTPAPFFQVGGQITVVPKGQVRESVSIGDYDMKEWPALGAGTTLRAQIGDEETRKLIKEFRLTGGSDDGKKLLVQGKVRYTDVFGITFESPFAFYAHRTKPEFRRPVSGLKGFQQVSS